MRGLALEQALRAGRLLGLAATNALELGIDISGLDAVLMAGFPGTRAALWQQVGRAGRGGAATRSGCWWRATTRWTPTWSTTPRRCSGAPVEANVFDPDNPYVLGPHLCAAAAELPLTEDGPAAVRAAAPATAVDALTEAGLLRRRPHGWFWTDRRRASDLADIRSSGGPPVRLVEDGTGRVLGTVDASSAHGTAHAGRGLRPPGRDLAGRRRSTSTSTSRSSVRADPDYSTSAREITDIEILARARARGLGRRPGCQPRRGAR